MAIYLGTNEVSATGTYNPNDVLSDAVRFIDYDGTILQTYDVHSFLALTTMPSNPSHTGLIAQGWNWSLSDAQNFVREWGALDIGQMYTTSDGSTQIDIELYEGRLSPYLSLCVNGTVSIDWGDGSSPTTLTGTSATSQTTPRPQHTYSTEGNYTIKINIVNGTYRFGGSGTYFLLNANSSSQNYNRVYANSIKAIRIGSGDIGLYQYAFEYCSSLKYITIPNSITAINFYLAFSYCYNLNFITIPYTENINNISINSQAFAYCYNLFSVSLTNKITSISGGDIFSNCYSLESLIIPNSIITIPYYLYSSTAVEVRLERLIIPIKNIKKFNLKNYNANVVLQGLTNIPANQFSGINDLKNITIPNTITTINGYAFYNCYSLTTVILPSTGINFNNPQQFYNCYSLHNINNFNKITSFGTSSPFSSCYSLSQQINFASTITSFPSSCFSNCYSLSYPIILPNGMTQISNSCFSSCYSIPKVTIPSTVTTIYSNAFAYCYGLTSITIPTSVTTIQGSAFAYCYGLGEIHIKPTTPPTLSGNIFQSLSPDCVIYVPQANLSAYQSAQYWSTYASQMVGE